MRINDQTLNRLAVLKAIRQHGPIARSDLPRLTELSAGTITQLTAELLRRGLILERKDCTKRNGRPRTFLEIARNGAVVVGASIEGQGLLTTAFVDLMGNLLFAHEAAYPGPGSLAALAAQIAESLAESIEASPFQTHEIARVGLALPAVVDMQRGDVQFMTTFPAGSVPFAEPISQRLNLPVTIENDMACRARAEHWFGCAQHLETFTMVHVGYSIGSAEYSDGLPQAGVSGLNPEFGHLKTDYGPQAPRCFCGARGCVTTYGSMYGILQQADLLANVPFPPVETIDARFDRFLDRADAGDPLAIELLDRAGMHLGRAVANHININDPGNVVISVLGQRFSQRIDEAFRASLIANAMPGVLPSTKIEIVVANDGWRRTGTAALALEQTYLSEA